MNIHLYSGVDCERISHPLIKLKVHMHAKHNPHGTHSISKLEKLMQLKLQPQSFPMNATVPILSWRQLSSCRYPDHGNKDKSKTKTKTILPINPNSLVTPYKDSVKDKNNLHNEPQFTNGASSHYADIQAMGTLCRSLISLGSFP